MSSWHPPHPLPAQQLYPAEQHPSAFQNQEPQEPFQAYHTDLYSTLPYSSIPYPQPASGTYPTEQFYDALPPNYFTPSQSELTPGGYRYTSSLAQPSNIPAPLPPQQPETEVYSPYNNINNIHQPGSAVNPTALQVPQAEAIPSSVRPIKLRLKPPAQNNNNEMTTRRHSSSAPVKAEPPYSSRPVREARRNAQQSLRNYNDDLPSDIDEDTDGGDENVNAAENEHSEYAAAARQTRSGRPTKPPPRYKADDEFEDRMMETSPIIPQNERRTSGRSRRKTYADLDEEDAEGEEEFIEEVPQRKPFPPRPTRASMNAIVAAAEAGPSYNNGETQQKRNTRTPKRGKSRHSSADGDSFEPSITEATSEPDDLSEDPMTRNFDEDEDSYASASPPPRRTRSKARRSGPTRRTTRQSARNHDSDDDVPVRRNLRERTSKVNYQLPPLDISAELASEVIDNVSRPGGGRRGTVGFAGGTRFGAGAGRKGLPWSLKGQDLAQAMGDPDTSDSDLDFPLRPTAAATGSGGQAGLPAPAVGKVNAPSDVPNFGRINPKSSTADADPLGVSMDITFDNVGGLDGHINQLKEMVALPLLYPELFQQFHITPPRGVLFHGPPGTGKTLLARALAASCSTGNTKISFFMRKGADVLSKWVGEAERQLRMLFEEARAAQPSIIFFDEIDGLAPVRSSKQDQIHASLVSTLLALMDGMDGRGQVIVIGATNRPDSVDPALRRPGRFDREFYFPLPNREARRKIIEINTRKWEPPLEGDMLDHLAVLTKGYGGADLRALCTEAALNAIQRRYPQIYKSQDRLLVQPGSVKVEARDFMMSVKKITPSSARSTASPAQQLPEHLVPLLKAPLDRLKKAVDHVLPERKNKTALEEAEWEDEGAGFEKEMMVQNLGKLRTFRPRILVYGKDGMGQAYLGPAVLHHLEGFHVQSLDLGGLMGDSARTTEAALVQLFVEAKRHQPSVLFIPSLSTWAMTVSDSARTTFKALLDSVSSSDPVLLLAMNDGELGDLPRDVRAWFGLGREGKLQLTPPTSDEREAYFASLLDTARKPPSEFPDAIPRRKRVLEELPLAPALPPRPPTEAEIQRELERDDNARNMMVISFTGLIQEFGKKYRKVVQSVRDEAMELSAYLAEQAATQPLAELALAPLEAESLPNGHSHGVVPLPPLAPFNSAPALTTVTPEDTTSAPPRLDSLFTSPVLPPAALPEPAPPVDIPREVHATWQAHDLTIDSLLRKLVRNKYHHPQDFLDDMHRIEENAKHIGDPEKEGRVAEMVAQAGLHISGFDKRWEPEFERLRERMRVRKENRAREKEKRKAMENGQVEPEPVVEDENGADGPSEDLAPAEGPNAKRAREDEGLEDRDGKRPRPEAMDIDSVIPEPPTIPPSLTDASGVVTVPPPRAPVKINPPPVYPPFILPLDLLDKLAAELTHATHNLNVDQLEQLRATCYDRVWRARAQWDRAELLRSLSGLVGEFVKEVEELQAEED
ncbi:hypothetical protein BCR39DRAFT_528294 [Naematelia encephala]|uniref:AAA+ ATPase domain-containing protein n=1 Tax=Naematelia encephala TaxID=71784 RepID=A0A1Y2B7S7_9TREE|nr:hypothetical protein BCR39DRAFT_528294 [Naematelia encephala]